METLFDNINFGTLVAQNALSVGVKDNGNKSDFLDLSNPYYKSHLITYIGNKRRLLPFLYKNFLDIKRKMGNKKLIVLDGFAGSGSVSRVLKSLSMELHVNDIESYARTLNEAYLTNISEINISELDEVIAWLNSSKLIEHTHNNHFIENNYAPADDENVQDGERVFYTKKNAQIIDNMRAYIEYGISKEYKTFCLAALLIKASVHNNTSGVFKGFHKKDGIGHFGGRGEHALSRIKQEINLDTPIFSTYECEVNIYQKDINTLVKDPRMPFFDVAYFDPPYNQHPYGSNYFMLNIINDGRPCDIQDGVSGIIKNWNTSAYNKRNGAADSLSQLIADTQASYIVISYNDEGIIPIEMFKQILSKHGAWDLHVQEYNTYRGSRNLRSRNNKVKELLWVLKKK